MLSRWETDDMAIILESVDNKNADDLANYKDDFIISDNTFGKWLSDMKLLHFNKQRRKTHLIAEIGTKHATFIDVSEKILQEFYFRYVNSGIHNKLSDEPKYIVELIDQHINQFKLFFDIDYDNKDLSDHQIEEICLILYNILEVKSIIYISGCKDLDNQYLQKTGIHLKCPGIIVSIDQALSYREKFITELYKQIPDNNWAHIIDSSVYGGSRGLRMFGSRKVTNGIDMGRVYKLFFAFDIDGNKYIPQLSDIELVKELSILI